MAGRRVPFAGGTDARVEVGLAFGDQAEFEGRGYGPPVDDVVAVEEALGRRVEVGLAGERTQSVRVRHGSAQLPGAAGLDARHLGVRIESCRDRLVGAERD